MYSLPTILTIRQNFLINYLYHSKGLLFMDLHSPKDKILLKNCIIVKLQQLKLVDQTPEIIDDISYFENLYQILKTDETETLIATLNDTTLQKKHTAFNQHILLTPPKELAQEYVTLTKSLMLANNAYSDEKFEDLQAAFYKGNEDLIVSSDRTKNSYELEEEPSDLPQNYLTQEQTNYLHSLDNLLKQNKPQNMSIEDFKAFSLQYKNLILALGKSKFEQTFAEEGKKVIDMAIAARTLEESKTVYETDFTLLDTNNETTHQVIRELASSSIPTLTAYQTLCYSYLEANALTRRK